MKFLFLTPQLPYPPEQGAALRNWGIIRELSHRHEIHLLAFADTPREQPGVASVTTVPRPNRTKRKRVTDLLTRTDPDMARRLWSESYATALEKLLAEQTFEVVQVEGIEMVPYALPYLGKTTRPLWVYDAHNAETALQHSAFRADRRNPRRLPHALYSAIQLWKLHRYEQRLLQRFDVVSAVSNEDVRLLQEKSGITPLLLPNGVDTEVVTPDSATPARPMLERAGPHLVFTGKMDFRPNVDGLLWFVKEILPNITTDCGVPTLWAVGKNPHESRAPLRDHPQVVVTGRVPLIEPYIAGADVVVVPLRMGSGTRLKVLQALSMAKPLVGTTLGCAGLDLRALDHVFFADEADAFAGAISHMLKNPSESAAMGKNAREHVQKYFDWRVLVPDLEAKITAALTTQ